MARITINGVSIDPLIHEPQLAALSLSSADASQSDFILVQVDGPLDAAKRKALTDAGCELLEFVPQNTYVAKFPGTDLTAVRKLPFVTWANIYLKGFKVNPDLMGADPNTPPMTLMERQGALRRIRGERKTVDIVLQKGADSQKVYDEVAQAAGVDPSTMPKKGRKIRLNVSVARLKRLADIDEVRHIEEVSPHSLLNDVASRILGADAVHAGVANVAGLDGAGQIVGICDTGFDKGRTNSVHPAFTGRIQKLYALGRNKADDPNGHGTHVAGSIAGNQNVTGHGRISGTAPGATLVVQSVLDARGGLGGIPDHLTDLFNQVYTADGVRVHSNSWGASDPSFFGRYDSEAFEVDEFVHDHRDMVVLFAAGNDGADENRNGVIDLGSVTPPGTAKNCITIGASESDRPTFALTYGQIRPNSFPIAPLSADRCADNPSGLAAFSSRGPTNDQRIKPDVVAPGTSILSTLSRNAQLDTFFGANPPAGYMYDTGTSMATPLAAGCATVVRQHLIRDRNLASPSAALVKAMLINGAATLSGQYVPSECGPVPNYNDGFGRIDLANVVQANLDIHDENTALDTGQSETFHVRTTAQATSVKVTLVWTDPPGEGLHNDLDLTVRAGSQERHGNMAPGSSDFDRINNVEQVVWTGLPAGTDIEITVQAFRSALQPQTYALVAKVF
ncbi:MAG TPA: S8 family serine peptidase [Stellaceae bacterium]|jgi:subtilisin family serine protease